MLELLSVIIGGVFLTMFMAATVMYIYAVIVTDDVKVYDKHDVEYRDGDNT